VAAHADPAVSRKKRVPGRPMPPDALEPWMTRLAPAPELREWILVNLIDEQGPLHNPDHKHLPQAEFECLWASTGFGSKGRLVVGQAEDVSFRCSKWQKWRQEQQMHEWFGRVPDFLITLDANYCRECSDAEFCALVEHECYHIAQRRDMNGNPVFNKQGQPVIELHAHDVEEFIGVVRRYGTGHPESNLARLVTAANSKPEVRRVSIANACGTCLRAVA
jgi:hypothetical protein